MVIKTTTTTTDLKTAAGCVFAQVLVLVQPIKPAGLAGYDAPCCLLT